MARAMTRREVVKAVVGAAAGTAVLGATGRARAQGGPVKIGFLYPDQGVFTQIGFDMRDGFLLYMNEVGNKAGGRPLEIHLETKPTNKPDDGLTKAKRLVEREKVHILGGVVSSPVAYALRGYVIEQKLPFVIMNAGADGLTQRQRSEWIFRSSYANCQSAHPLGDWVHKQGYKKVVVAGSDFVTGHESIGPFARVYTELGGQVIQEIYPPLGTPDFAPYLTQIRKDADAAVVLFAGADAVRWVKQYEEYGLKARLPLIGKGSITDEQILPQQGDAALGIVSTLQWSAALDTPQNRKFLTAYESKYKRPATQYAEQGYVGAQMIVKALDAVRGNAEDKPAFLAAMKKVEIDAPRGPVHLDDYNNPVQTVYVLRTERKGGQLQNSVIGSYPKVSQFWKWTPEQFLAMPAYPDLKGKWAK
jgi:branched-chain amino acid transport system substrate-binding protein